MLADAIVATTGAGADVTAPSSGVATAAEAIAVDGPGNWTPCRRLTGMRLLPSAYNNSGALLAQPASSSAITIPACLIIMDLNSGEVKRRASSKPRSPALSFCWQAAAFSVAPH
jgi:hypothetical protein